MTARALRLALLLLAAAASPARAQLGIDLTDDEPRKPADKKAKPADKKAPPKAAPRPVEKPPAPPVVAPAPAPVPIPPPPPAARPRPPPASTFEAVDLASKGQGKARLDAAKKLLAEKETETAALAFDAILRDPSLADVHDEARFRLAIALSRAGLHHSALGRFDEVLARGAQGSRFFHNSLEWIFYLGRRTANESVILSRVARFAGEPFPPGAQDKFHTLLARYSYERGLALSEAGQQGEARKAWEEARKLASRVRGDAPAPVPGAEVEASSPADGNLPARARFIEGLVRYAEGDSQGAVEAFQSVVRLTNPRRTRVPDPAIRDLAFAQLGRIHYEYKQNRYAIFYYQRMTWGGSGWLEGLWESSYAWYRIGDYEKALGNLITLHSPYFEDEYFPESHLLKAIIYYENCRYPEARSILEDFSASYEPVFAELDRLTGRGAPAELFELIERVQKGQVPAGPAMRKVLKAAFTDRNIERLDVSIHEVEAEIEQKLPRTREAFRGSPLAQDLRRQLETERKRLVTEASARARQKLEYERDGLRELLQQALRIKIEVSRQERETLEASLGSGGKDVALRPYRFSAAVSDEHLYWPYQGEFWRDELGTYAYTLTRGCRERSPAGGSR